MRASGVQYRERANARHDAWLLVGWPRLLSVPRVCKCHIQHNSDTARGLISCVALALEHADDSYESASG